MSHRPLRPMKDSNKFWSIFDHKAVRSRWTNVTVIKDGAVFRQMEIVRPKRFSEQVRPTYRLRHLLIDRAMRDWIKRAQDDLDANLADLERTLLNARAVVVRNDDLRR